jgi:hypothetical protein
VYEKNMKSVRQQRGIASHRRFQGHGSRVVLKVFQPVSVALQARALSLHAALGSRFLVLYDASSSSSAQASRRRMEELGPNVCKWVGTIRSSGTETGMGRKQKNSKYEQPLRIGVFKVRLD